jgi:hypothetical protein
MRKDMAFYFILMLAAALAFAACGGGSGGGVIIGGDPWGGTVMVNTTSQDDAQGVAVDAGGNVYVVGQTSGSLHGHTSLGADNDGFVAMYAPTGSHVRTLMINTAAHDGAIDVAVDAGGNVYVAGVTLGDLHGHTNLAGDGFVAMYNSTGGHVRTLMINSSALDVAEGVAVDANGNVYVAGETRGDLHGHTLIGVSDGFVAMYNSAGDHVRTLMINTSGWDQAYDVAVDELGNVYVTGETNGDLHGHTSLGADYDGFVAMYNSTGGHEWTAMQNTAGSDNAEGVAVDASGNVYVAGGTSGNLHEHTLMGGSDGFVAMYNSTGGHEWTAMQNSSAGDWTFDVAVSSGGNAYVTGKTGGDLHGHTQIGAGDGFVTIYDSLGVRQWTAMINTSAEDIAYGVAVDAGGNAFVAGETGGNLHGHTLLGSFDGFVAKFSSSGALK